MNQLNRPYIICHMTTSINGKITGEYLEKNIECVNEYYRLHKEFNADGFLCGRVTMESSFTQGYYPNLDKYQNCKVERLDYVAGNYEFYAIAIDFHAKLGWENNHIIDDDSGYNNAHIIEILSENVSDSFLAYLREKKISYIFAGNERLDLKLAMRKLKELFNINLLLLEGGGIIDGSFLQEDLIDEMSLVIAPSIEYSANTKELFFNESHLLKQFSLASVEKIPGNGLWLRYKCDSFTDDIIIHKAKILEIEEDRILIKPYDTINDDYFYLLISSNTKIDSNLKVGDYIEAYIDNKFMMSYPGQVNAFKISLIKNENINSHSQI